ncbi:MAG TPA: hypothetical protein VHF86_05905, partial [Xanthomonadaceae bacterium]|nr:hypothetical protein [Xanthomonadaceae bacterium]
LPLFRPDAAGNLAAGTVSIDQRTYETLRLGAETVIQAHEDAEQARRDQLANAILETGMGVLEAGFGAALTIGSGGVLAGVGVLMMADGAQRTASGVRNAVTGHDYDTYLSKEVLQEGMGMSRDAANRVDTGVMLATTLPAGGYGALRTGMAGVSALQGAAALPGKLKGAGMLSTTTVNTGLLVDTAQAGARYVATGDGSIRPVSTEWLMQAGMSETQANYVVAAGGLGLGMAEGIAYRTAALSGRPAQTETAGAVPSSGAARFAVSSQGVVDDLATHGTTEQPARFAVSSQGVIDDLAPPATAPMVDGQPALPAAPVPLALPAAPARLALPSGRPARPGNDAAQTAQRPGLEHFDPDGPPAVLDRIARGEVALDELLPAQQSHLRSFHGADLDAALLGQPPVRAAASPVAESPSTMAPPAILDRIARGEMVLDELPPADQSFLRSHYGAELAAARAAMPPPPARFAVSAQGAIDDLAAPGLKSDEQPVFASANVLADRALPRSPVGRLEVPGVAPDKLLS